nr:hypothetical protein [Senegalimassilia anaerobia]
MLFRLRRVGIAPAFKNSVSRLRTLAFVLLARLLAPQQFGQRRNGAHPTAKRLPKHKRNDRDSRKADEHARDESPATEYGFQRTERADIRDSVVTDAAQRARLPSRKQRDKQNRHDQKSNCFPNANHARPPFQGSTLIPRRPVAS